MPGLCSDLFPSAIRQKESGFLYNSQVGYEVKPMSFINVTEYNRRKTAPLWEQVNSEGFRGPEYAIPKPKGVFRIMAIGDSFTQGFCVRFIHTWEQFLENALNHRAVFSNSDVRYEVINAGVGGYVSWQVLARLKRRVLKYQPDLVLVAVGLNDLLFSTLPYWRPDLDLSDIDQAYEGDLVQDNRTGLWAKIRIPLYRYSYIARLIREARNGIWNYWRIKNTIRQHQRDSNIEFNRKALELYLNNLEDIYNVIQASSAGMGIFLWATVLNAELINDSSIHRRLVPICNCYSLSTRELFDWNRRYIETVREFCEIHPDIIPIDVETAFKHQGRKERLKLFIDFFHLGVEGQRLLSEIILDKLVHKGLVR